MRDFLAIEEVDDLGRHSQALERGGFIHRATLRAQIGEVRAVHELARVVIDALALPGLVDGQDGGVLDVRLGARNVEKLLHSLGVRLVLGEEDL